MGLAQLLPKTHVFNKTDATQPPCPTCTPRVTRVTRVTPRLPTFPHALRPVVMANPQPLDAELGLHDSGGTDGRPRLRGPFTAATGRHGITSLGTSGVLGIGSCHGTADALQFGDKVFFDDALGVGGLEPGQPLLVAFEHQSAVGADGATDVIEGAAAVFVGLDEYAMMGGDVFAEPDGKNGVGGHFLDFFFF